MFNETQLAAAQWPRDEGALLLCAGAGTGKTSTIAARVAHLVATGTDPSRIMLLTFTKRAAADVIRRVIVMLRETGYAPRPAIRLDWAGTFHAVGARLLRRFAPQIGLPDGFSVHDRDDSSLLMDIVRTRFVSDRALEDFPSTAICLQIYSRCLNLQAALSSVIEQSYPWCTDLALELGALFDAYQDAKRRQNVIDFDDLLVLWLNVLAMPHVADQVRSSVDALLIDEVQDCNALQASVIRAMRPCGTGVMMVGDEAQAIYGFRGGDVEIIRGFRTMFGRPSQVMHLALNYRSTHTIIDVANAVMTPHRSFASVVLEATRTDADEIVAVQVPDEGAQATYVAEAIRDAANQGMPYAGFAVLVRESGQSAMLEIELTRHNVPFVKVGGPAFLDHAHIKDVVAVLRFSANVRDAVSGLRGLRLIAGIGHSRAQGIIADFLERSVDDLRTILLAASAEAPMTSFVALMEELTDPALHWPRHVEVLLDWYLPVMRVRYPNPNDRTEHLLSLKRMAAQCASRDQFLTDLSLDASEFLQPRRRGNDCVVISTIHSAKGQEWPNVFVLNCIEGCIPSSRAVGEAINGEERRLLYVAVTRARDHLCLMVPSRYGDSRAEAVRSRFLDEKVMAQIETVHFCQPERTVGVHNRGNLDARIPNRPLW